MCNRVDHENHANHNINCYDDNHHHNKKNHYIHKNVNHNLIILNNLINFLKNYYNPWPKQLPKIATNGPALLALALHTPAAVWQCRRSALGQPRRAPHNHQLAHS